MKKVRNRPRRVFGYTDIHGDVHDPVALTVAKRAQQYFKPDITVIGGDLLNCEPFTRHARQIVSPEDAQDWGATELQFGIKFLDFVQKHTKGTTWFLEGNHDAWVERWCANTGVGGRSLYSLLSPKRHFTRHRKNFKYVSYIEREGVLSAYASLHPHLVVVHGWSCCKHAAAKHLELSRSRSIVFNHCHRQLHVVGRDPWTGRPIEALSAGCLCKLQPIYKHGGEPTQWIHGFWVAYLGRTSYTLYPVTIYKGSAVLPDGKEIRL